MKESLADAVDLSTVVMTHYNLRQVSAGSLGLSTPAIDPSYVPTASDVGTVITARRLMEVVVDVLTTRCAGGAAGQGHAVSGSDRFTAPIRL